jgi:hypothetical protein
VTEREVLLQRRATLVALLASPNGPLGPNAGAIGERLRRGWQTEVRLLDRLLAETPGDDVRTTIAAWQARTVAFAARSPGKPTAWTDRQGLSWDADVVLCLLGELTERIDRWMTAAGPEGQAPRANEAGP